MLIAHLPAGYLLGRAIKARGPVMAAALVGSVAPDLDMFWFYLVDSSIHHHRFWPHIPAIWAIAALITLPLLAQFARSWLPVACAFFAAITLHLLLDTIGGGIMWLWPLNNRLYSLVTVPATQSHWIASFVLHWTFLAELALWAAALFLFLQRRKQAKRKVMKYPRA